MAAEYEYMMYKYTCSLFVWKQVDLWCVPYCTQCLPQSGVPGCRAPLLLHVHAPYEPIMARVVMAESRIIDFFAAAPAQKRSRQENSDSLTIDSEAVSVPFLATSTASDTSMSTGSGTCEYRHFRRCFYT